MRIAARPRGAGHDISAPSAPRRTTILLTGLHESRNLAISRPPVNIAHKDKPTSGNVLRRVAFKVHLGSCIFRDEPCDPVSCDACYVWSLTINVSRAVPRPSARPLRSAGLRAGAPYLPVDPASPRPLIQYQRLACLLVLVRAGAGRPHGRPLGPSQSHLALHAWLWVVPPLAVSPYPNTLAERVRCHLKPEYPI